MHNNSHDNYYEGKKAAYAPSKKNELTAIIGFDHG